RGPPSHSLCPAAPLLSSRSWRQPAGSLCSPPSPRTTTPDTHHHAVPSVLRKKASADQRGGRVISRLQGEGKRPKPRARRPPSPPTEEARAMSSSSSSSMGGSLALAAATAVAFSGSLVIFSLCRAHLSPHDASGPSPPEKRRRGRRVRRSKAEKRVRFAADVVDNEGAPPPTRHPAASSASASAAATCRGAAAESDERMMPANREALYRGMLRDRSAHRVTCSY
ncbi:unnamed protein product, partial [Urochloa humidicola]